MKRSSLILKVAFVALLIPSLSFAAVQKGGSTRAGAVKIATKADIASAVKEANVDVDAAKLADAMDATLINKIQLNSILNGVEDGKISKDTASAVLKMVAEEKGYTQVDIVGGSRDKLSDVRAHIVTLAIGLTQGSTHSPDSLAKLANVMESNFKDQTSTIAALDNVKNTLKETSTEDVLKSVKDEDLVTEFLACK